MIFDKLENLDKYASVHPRFVVAIPFLKKMIAENAETGRYVMPNCDTEAAVYASVYEYNTKLLSENSKMEAHRKYIDIQIILEGEENIYLSGTQTGESMSSYDEVNDFELMEMPEIDSTVRLTMPKGSFAIFFVGEQHAPNHAVGEPMSVRKVVGKVLQ